MIDYILNKVRINPSRRAYYGYGGYSDREDYYQNLFTERHSDTILQLLQQKDEVQLSARSLSIQFKDVRFGASTKEAQKQLGKPRYTIENPRVAQHEVHFYRFKVHRLHSVATLHFLADRLFLASHTFRHLDRPNYQQVLAALSDKYGLEATPDKTTVKDSQGNTVSIIDGLYFVVQYVSGDPFFSEHIIRHSAEQQQQEQLREAERLSSISNFL